MAQEGGGERGRAGISYATSLHTGPFSAGYYAKRLRVDFMTPCRVLGVPLMLAAVVPLRLAVSG
eukprot:scaffold16122_cov215-Skeletonema_marinoi.AAC.3